MTSPTWSDEPPKEDCWLWVRRLSGEDVPCRWDAGDRFGVIPGYTVKADGMKKFGPRIPTPDELASLYADRERLKRLAETYP